MFYTTQKTNWLNPVAVTEILTSGHENHHKYDNKHKKPAFNIFWLKFRLTACGLTCSRAKQTRLKCNKVSAVVPVQSAYWEPVRRWCWWLMIGGGITGGQWKRAGKKNFNQWRGHIVEALVNPPRIWCNRTATKVTPSNRDPVSFRSQPPKLVRAVERHFDNSASFSAHF